MPIVHEDFRIDASKNCFIGVNVEAKIHQAYEQLILVQISRDFPPPFFSKPEDSLTCCKIPILDPILSLFKCQYLGAAWHSLATHTTKRSN